MKVAHWNVADIEALSMARCKRLTKTEYRSARHAHRPIAADSKSRSAPVSMLKRHQVPFGCVLCNAHCHALHNSSSVQRGYLSGFCTCNRVFVSALGTFAGLAPSYCSSSIKWANIPRMTSRTVRARAGRPASQGNLYRMAMELVCRSWLRLNVGKSFRKNRVNIATCSGLFRN